jgi:hypothetical protein
MKKKMSQEKLEALILCGVVSLVIGFGSLIGYFECYKKPQNVYRLMRLADKNKNNVIDRYEMIDILTRMGHKGPFTETLLSNYRLNYFNSDSKDRAILKAIESYENEQKNVGSDSIIAH